MIQIFLKYSKISAKDWENVYNRILLITNKFPLQLVHIEAYNDFQKGLDRHHLDLINDKNTENEHIRFYGDITSNTYSFTIRFGSVNF